jgi:hypothetical protein
LSSSVSADRFLSTNFSTTAPNSTTVTRVSRFEAIFEQMRKKNHLGLEAASKPIVPSKIDTFSTWDQQKASANFGKEPFQSEQATESFDPTAWPSFNDLHTRRSSGTDPNVLVEAVGSAPNSNPTPIPTRKQEILQMPNWRALAQNPRNDTSLEGSTGNWVPSESEKLVSTRSETIEVTVRAKQAAIVKQFGPGTLRTFHPSHRALQRSGLLPDRDASRASTDSSQSSSPNNYLGDPFVENNRSADVSEDKNCSLWVWGLPATVTYPALLASIRGIGKIYATVINPPTTAIRTSAAKIVLFNRRDAGKLFNMIENRQFVVTGKTVHRVLWNKIRSGPYPHPNHSRAIRITGPPELMDFDFFDDFFIRRFTYDLEGRRVVKCLRPGLVSHEWHFGSLRCQAASAKTAIERELKGIYEVEWADDPCEFP